MCAVCNWKTFSCSLNICYMYLFIQFMDIFVCDRLLLSPFRYNYGVLLECFSSLIITIFGAVVVEIVWELELQLHVQ